MSKKAFLKTVFVAAVLSLSAVSQALAAYEYFDDFTTLDSFWWTVEDSSPYTMVKHVDTGTQQFIFMRQAPDTSGYLSGAAKLKFNFPLQGDFSASITYNLVTWPTANNYSIAGIRTGLGDVERIAGAQSELYQTAFVGDSIHTLSTTELQGRLRIERKTTDGISVLTGYWYYKPEEGVYPWQVIGQYIPDNTDDTFLELSLWPGLGANQEVKVVFDDFNLHVYDDAAVDPRNVVPEPVSMLLFGFGAAAMAVMKRKKL